MQRSKKKEPSIEIEILGKTWRAYLTTKKKVQKVAETPEAGNTEAITVAASREIYFSKSDFSWRVVVHELVHAHLDILGTNSAGEHLSIDAYEEQVCELLSNYHGEIFWVCSQIYKEFRGHVDGDEELNCLKRALKEILSWESTPVPENKAEPDSQ